jgi:hypothetical protein
MDFKMKLDGHAKLTNSAMISYKSKCAMATSILLNHKLCRSTQFSTLNKNWADGENSNVDDNDMMTKYIIIQELSIFGEGALGLKQGYLVREVVAVDLEPMKLRHHFLDAGQKFHFMRRSTKPNISLAHEECVGFIKESITKWISLMTRALSNRRGAGRRKITTVGLRREAASNMALALHALQDSFSPGHTKREKFTDPNFPGDISDIYIYSSQDHDKHSDDDFDSGSLSSVHAKAAIQASSELMYMAAKSVVNKSVVPIDWNEFQSKWLKMSGSKI